MANYANQKTVTIEGVNRIQHTKDSGNDFVLSIDFKYEEAAMMRLNGNAFKVWRYLLRWAGKGKVDYSPAALHKLGLGKNAPSDAFNELIHAGYLKQDQNTLNRYIFNPVLEADYQLLSKETG